MSRRNRLLFLALVLLLAVPLMLLLRSFVREAIAVPLLRILWVGQILFQSIPQPLLWALLLTIVLLLAMRSLVRRRKPAQETDRAETVYPGRVRTLTKWLQHIDKGYYFKRRLAQHLVELTAEALAVRERQALGQIRRRLESLDAPPEIQAYLQAGLKPVSPQPVGFLSKLARRLRLSTQPSPLDLDPERAIQFLEDQMEVGYDHRNR